jgi:hypothetical protein
MKKDQLESLLRAPVEAAIPRPGFETRIQALSREPFEAKKKNRSWIAIPAFAAITLGLVLSRSNDKPAPAVVVAPPPVVEEKDESLSFIEDTAVYREIEAVKSDAEKTMSFLSRSLPSLSLTKKKK